MSPAGQLKTGFDQLLGFGMRTRGGKQGFISIQVNKPTAAMPPSITAGGIGAAVTVSQ